MLHSRAPGSIRAEPPTMVLLHRVLLHHSDWFVHEGKLSMSSQYAANEREHQIRTRFGDSRAALMTQLFTSLATGNGVALVAVIGLYGRVDNQELGLLPVITVALLGLGMATVLLSGFFRFRNSENAQKKQIAEIQGDDQAELCRIERRGERLRNLYRRLMWISLCSFIAAIAVFVIAAYLLTVQ